MTTVLLMSSYPNSQRGDFIDPAALPLNSYNRVDQYIWAVLRARNSPEIIRDDFTCLVLPNVNTPRGFSSSADVRRSCGSSANGTSMSAMVLAIGAGDTELPLVR